MTRRTRAHPPCRALLGSLALTLMPALSQAQSAYSVTVLKSPTSYAMEEVDMDHTGTVVGCVDGVPFIWKNGVTLDLVKEVNSKGAKLPSSVVHECPVAINDVGTILTSYRAPRTARPEPGCA